MSMHQWKLGVKFEAYSWNAVPVVRADIKRLLVAIGWSFPFPVEYLDPPMALGGEVEAAGIQTADHRAERAAQTAKKQGADPKAFDTGDLVIIRKQAKSSMADRVSGKLLIKAKGLYQVLSPDSSSFYKIQRLPFC
eukprot:4315744-Ditylum_brightwellii.AAC.2